LTAQRRIHLPRHEGLCLGKRCLLVAVICVAKKVPAGCGQVE